MGQYAHGNEPVHHVTSMYALGGAKKEGEEIIHRVMDELYNSGPSGYCGDEDNGQMAAWYIWNSIGMYSMTPGTGEYVFGSPNVDSAFIKIQGKTCEIQVKKVKSNKVKEEKYKYIDKIFVNGNRWTKLFITHDIMAEGAKIEFVMSNEPKERKLIDSDYPTTLTSMIDERGWFKSVDKLKLVA
ncbi:hypothetical protein EIN_307920 [Entamoeba invadens IP1]|uniref:Glycosyl hydrolase family 92 domain-containing protein n=1 Tax=Entamoeba invadens IP1 TaxID=370355 RepID=A0A0A1U4T2_ENTIV|nr:hypothetical protein EIN_307920 [Entamoeba invadens IP1]ELP86746.1 hypothetical protein EIN_307920 [Entamoeba invadens IP1]|eukprot:XP_004186092.1 hypothetical protein EIN_307920 [Entamoeba invadens IP1]